MEFKQQAVVTPELHHILNGIELCDLAEILHTFIPEDLETEVLKQVQHKQSTEGYVVMFCLGNEYAFEALDHGWVIENEVSPIAEILSVLVEIDIEIPMEMINKLNKDNPYYQYFKKDNKLCVRQVHDFRYGGMRIHHFISHLQSLINMVSLLTTKCQEAG